MSTVSPELALVDPDLRATAIAGLPAVQPYAFLDFPALPPVVVVPRVSRVRAAAVYTGISLVRTLAVNAAVLVGIAVVVLVINLFA